MKPEAFRLQPEEHGFLRSLHRNEDRRCPAPGIVPRRCLAAIQMESMRSLDIPHENQRINRLGEGIARGDAETRRHGL